jgi:hypothetical protein
MNEKIERDGKVAVLYSPGYGAGWSTWIDENLREKAIFCPRLVLAVLGESGEDRAVVASEEFPDEYHGGLSDLKVAWLDEGTEFKIREYDGYESIDTSKGIVA